jgi:hypothetical protein
MYHEMGLGQRERLTRNRVDGGFWFTLAYIHLPESRRHSLGAAVDSTCAERSLIRAYRPSHKSAATCSKEIVEQGAIAPACLGKTMTPCASLGMLSARWSL